MPLGFGLGFGGLGLGLVLGQRMLFVVGNMDVFSWQPKNADVGMECVGIGNSAYCCSFAQAVLVYMGIWVYRYMGIWVYGYIGIWVYGYMGIWSLR